MANDNKILRLPNLYVLIVIALTYTAAQFWPVFSIAGLFMLVGLLLPFVIAPSYYSSKLFIPVVLYLAVVFLNILLGDDFFPDYRQLAYEAVYLIIPSSMLFYVNAKDDSNERKGVVYTFLIILILTTIATYVLSQIYPSVVRQGNTYTREEGENFYKGLYRFGFATYDMTHAVPCLVPVLFYAWRHSFGKGIKIFLLICIIACLVLSYVSGSFACLVMSFAALIISFFIKPGSVKENMSSLIILGILMLIVLNDNVILSVTSFLDNLMGHEGDFHEKLIDVQQTIITGESQGDFAARNELYGKSFKSFGSNILFGSDGSNLGGHSAFMDRLGSLGLIGFIPYAIFLCRCVTYAYNHISYNCRIYYVVGAFISLSMLLSKALSGWDMWLVLLFVLPSVLQTFDRSEEVE